MTIKDIYSVCIILVLLSCGCGREIAREQDVEEKISTVEALGEGSEIAVEAPPFSEGIFPCSECHDYQESNPERRVLGWHEDIEEIMDHDNENRWCLDCHDALNRDYLRLASGKTLDFKESYKLCGQCHGDRLRDWKVGVHGKRTGEWNGEKQYLLCVHCHDPHTPRFKMIVPDPPPDRQKSIYNKSDN